MYSSFKYWKLITGSTVSNCMTSWTRFDVCLMKLSCASSLDSLVNFQPNLDENSFHHTAHLHRWPSSESTRQIEDDLYEVTLTAVTADSTYSFQIS